MLSRWQLTSRSLKGLLFQRLHKKLPKTSEIFFYDRYKDFDKKGAFAPFFYIKLPSYIYKPDELTDFVDFVVSN
jgi:hypothetical protein